MESDYPLALIQNVEERRGLLFAYLRKLICFENTKMVQLVYPFSKKIMGRLIELAIVQQNFVLIYFKFG